MEERNENLSFNDEFRFKNKPDESTPKSAENLNVALENTSWLKQYINDIITGKVDLLVKSIKSINMIKPTALSGATIDDDGIVTWTKNFTNAGNSSVTFNNVTLEAGKKYTLKIFCNGGTISGGSYKVVYGIFSKTKTIGNLNSTGTLKYTFTYDDDHQKFTAIHFDISAGTNITNLKIGFMLYEGEDDKEYSPHQL